MGDLRESGLRHQSADGVHSLQRLKSNDNDFEQRTCRIKSFVLVGVEHTMVEAQHNVTMGVNLCGAEVFHCCVTIPNCRVNLSE